MTDFLQELSTACNALLYPLGLSVRYHVPAGSVCTRFDEDSLSLAVLNLLSNALLYGDGRADLTVSEHGNRVLIGVGSRGFPLNEDALLRMFDPFYAYHPSGPSRAGSGIGLTVAKLTATAHQGTAFAEHNRGVTRVYLSLPLCRETGAPHRSRTAADHLQNRFSVVRVILANVPGKE